jgi:hypothetical protein
MKSVEVNKVNVARRLVSTFNNVSVHLDCKLVPRDEVGLHFVGANTTLGFDSHFQKGIPIGVRGGRSVVMNMHFYGVNTQDLGYKHNFRVEVWEKTIPAGTFTFLDLRKVGGASEASMKINIGHPELGGNIQIAGTNAFIRIVPLQKAKAEITGILRKESAECFAATAQVG